jgi:hypothetical protein
MPIDDATWADVRLAYVGSTVPVAAICNHFNVDTRTLYARAKREKWPKRSKMLAAARLAATRAAMAAGTPSSAPFVSQVVTDVCPFDYPLPSNPKARSALIRRLYNAINTKLQQMERLMATATDTSAVDHERETRTLTALIRNFERVSEFDPTIAKSTKAAVVAAALAADAKPSGRAIDGTDAAPPTSGPDAERLRRDIAERLVRIHEQRGTPRDPG